MTYTITSKNGTFRISDRDFCNLKKPTLSIQTGNEIRKIGSFNDLESAKTFLRMFGVDEDDSCIDSVQLLGRR